jgi:hypothetical protein
MKNLRFFLPQSVGRNLQNGDNRFWKATRVRLLHYISRVWYYTCFIFKKNWFVLCRRYRSLLIFLTPSASVTCTYFIRLIMFMSMVWDCVSERRPPSAIPNVMVELLTLLLCIREVPGSNLDPDTFSFHWGFCFSSVPPGKCRDSVLN